jgi:hypothetical protein
MKRFVAKRLSAIRKSKPTGSDFDGIDVAASFRAVVDDIVVANRQPTAWEAGCLYAALCEIANGRERNARRRICLARLPGALQELPVRIFPRPTAEELLQALALISQTDPNKSLIRPQSE